MKKALISFGLLGLLIVVTDAFATAPNPNCSKSVQAANAACNKGSPPSQSTPGSVDENTGLNETTTTYTGGAQERIDFFAALITACKPKLKKCQSDCQGADASKCDPAKSKLEQAEKELGQGNDNKDAGKKSDGQSGMPQMPQMPQQQQDQQQQPQAQAAPASTDSNDCTQNPSGANCSSSKTDSTTNPATPAGFANGSGGGGGGSSGSGGTNFSDNASAPAQPAAATGGGYPSGSSGGGAGGSGSSNNANAKDPNAAAYADMGKDLTNVLNGERGGGGGGGGGGGFGYSAGTESSNLASYLPGGKNYKGNDPKMAAANRKPASMEIASVHENIFSMITKRFQILCKLREIRDCN